MYLLNICTLEWEAKQPCKNICNQYALLLCQTVFKILKMHTANKKTSTCSPFIWVFGESLKLTQLHVIVNCTQPDVWCTTVKQKMSLENIATFHTVQFFLNCWLKKKKHQSKSILIFTLVLYVVHKNCQYVFNLAAFMMGYQTDWVKYLNNFGSEFVFTFSRTCWVCNLWINAYYLDYTVDVWGLPIYVYVVICSGTPVRTWKSFKLERLFSQGSQPRLWKLL